MKIAQQIITKRSALFGAIIPRGISRIAVLGFRASKLRSRYRLNAIAALLAVTIQINTRNKRANSGLKPGNPFSCIIFVPNMPRKNPIIPKGNANKVCENLIKLR